MAPSFDRRSLIRFGLGSAALALPVLPALPAVAGVVASDRRHADHEPGNLLAREFAAIAAIGEARGGAVLDEDGRFSVEAPGFFFVSGPHLTICSVHGMREAERAMLAWAMRQIVERLPLPG